MLLAAPQGKFIIKTFEDDFRFVPRVHVGDSSFGVMGSMEFRGCSYDTLYEGYWCPIRD